jgi:hydrogenase maturation protease
VDVIDLGTGGLAVVHEMAHRPKVIFVDCALMDEAPGTLRRFTPDEVVTRKIQTRLSLHEGDLMQSIALSRQLGECPPEIVIFGIQPKRVEMGESLSNELQARLSEYEERVLAEVRPTA